MFLLAELDLPTLLLGLITSFATAVGMLYRDMRKDMLTITNQAVEDRKKCDLEISRLYAELDVLRNFPCMKGKCILSQEQDKK